MDRFCHPLRFAGGKGALKKAHQEMFEAILTHDRQRCEAAIDRHYDIIERRIQEG